MEYLAKRPTVEANVKAILTEVPQTRGDDLLLIYYYWRKHDKIRIGFEKFKDLFSATCPESIRRSRQKIQADINNQHLRPTERVRKKRRANEREHIDYYRPLTQF
jgi:hypothetical protein